MAGARADAGLRGSRVGNAAPGQPGVRAERLASRAASRGPRTLTGRDAAAHSANLIGNAVAEGWLVGGQADITQEGAACWLGNSTQSTRMQLRRMVRECEVSSQRVLLLKLAARDSRGTGCEVTQMGDCHGDHWGVRSASREVECAGGVRWGRLVATASSVRQAASALWTCNVERFGPQDVRRRHGRRETTWLTSAESGRVYGSSRGLSGEAATKG